MRREANCGEILGEEVRAPRELRAVGLDAPPPEVPSATHWHHVGQIPPFPPKAVNLQVCSRVNSHSLSLQIPVCQSPPENRILKRSRLVAEGQAGPQAPCSVHRPSITRSAQHLPHGWAQVPADEAALGGSQALHKVTALVPFELPCVFQGTPAPASLWCRDDAGAPVLGGLGCYQEEPSGSAARDHVLLEPKLSLRSWSPSPEARESGVHSKPQ